MALSWCLDRIESTSPGTLTIYGEYLARHPPEREVEIVDRTSWSCPHGIRRWNDGCSCASGRHPGWQPRLEGAPAHRHPGTRDQPHGDLLPVRQGRSSPIPGRRGMTVSGYSGTVHLNPSKDSSMDHAARALNRKNRIRRLHCLRWPGRAWRCRPVVHGSLTISLIVKRSRSSGSAARAIQIASDWTGTLL